MTSPDRGQWGSKLGFILAAAGSAIGLGNIWRFPATAGLNGGAAFVLVYVASVFIISSSIMIAEFAIGRHTQRNPVGAFNAIAPGTLWKYVGLLGVLTGWAITSYYAVVAGWTVGYLFKTAMGQFSGTLTADDVKETFASFAGDPLTVIALLALFIILTMAILLAGVRAGIERWSKILMPVLLVLLVLLVVRSVTLPGASAGLSFFLEPDWDKLSMRNVLAAMGQAFFSLSLGMGTMITYGSYLSRKENLVSSVAWVCSLDTAIALLAGLAIFPALFTVSGLNPTEGASLIFVVLPNVFNQIPLGDLFGTGFFLLLAIAALTSSISILIVPVAYFEDEKGWSRKKAVLVSGTFAFVLGIPSALSFGGVGWLSNLFSLEDRTYGFLDMMNLLFGQYSLMIGSLLIALFVGWKWGIAGARLEIEQRNPAFKMKTVFAFLIRFLCPVAIASLLAYLVFVDPNAFA